MQSNSNTVHHLHGVLSAIQQIYDKHKKLWLILAVTYIIVLVLSHIVLYSAVADWEEQQSKLNQAVTIAQLTHDITQHDGLDAVPEFDKPRYMSSSVPSPFVWTVWGQIIETKQTNKQMWELTNQYQEWAEIAQEDYLAAR